MKVTIIPSDKMVIVDGRPLNLEFALPNVHAVQWRETEGEIDYTDGRERKRITSLDAGLQSLIVKYEVEKQRIADANAAAEAARDPVKEAARANALNEFRTLTVLATKTDAGIQTYINANVTDLASAKTAILLLARAVGALARNQGVV